MKPELFFVFDVESAGLHGEGFAWGFVVVDRDGVEQGSGYGAITPDFAGVSDDDLNWLKENVLRSLFGYTHTIQPSDDYKTTSQTRAFFRTSFWDSWLEWYDKGAVMVTDCGTPVETNFLRACLIDQYESRKAQGPYPLLDVSSILFAAGKDPVGTFERKIGESPKHNPLTDARQSARILIETLNELKR